MNDISATDNTTTAKIENRKIEECLAELNAAQHAAATFGISRACTPDLVPPLLIIAGAGSGKTKTLTHRVAHLVLNGVDPRRILLMTFARRMAAEMTRRVEHICARALKGRMAVSADAIEWSGTFHAIGAKLLRLHAESIGLAPSFSILDRADAEDLMDLVRNELGLSATKNRFPKKSTCLAIYSYTVNAQSTVIRCRDPTGSGSACGRRNPRCADKGRSKVRDAADVEVDRNLNASAPFSQKLDRYAADRTRRRRPAGRTTRAGARPRCRRRSLPRS
jgi:UvrD/REP helicase N-terminal domain